MTENSKKQWRNVLWNDETKISKTDIDEKLLACQSEGHVIYSEKPNGNFYLCR